MNKHRNKKRIIKFDWQEYFVRLFNNPIGRLYLGVPKGKHIYKITKSSVHYYTGEIAKNGLPIICTGGCFPGGKNIENKILKLSKVISCIAFLPFLPKVLLPLIALTDTGVKAPSATGGKYNTWTNPSYAYTDDDTYATRRNIVAGKQSYESFGFSITNGSTINGIEVSVKGKVDIGDAPVGFNVYNNSSSSWATEYLGEYGVGGIWDSTEKTITYGGSSYLWGKSWAVSDFSNTNFSAYITTVSDRANIYMLNLITVKVYYTEPVVAPTVTTQSADQIATTSIRGNGNITDTGGANCTRRGFCYKAGTSGDPTTSDSVAYDDGSFGTGAFTKSITGLTAGTSYRVRAYAVNSAGTSYGTTVTVTTLKAFKSRTTWF